MTKEVFIWGAGGHGRVLLDILRKDKKIKVVGFIDENLEMKGEKIEGVLIYNSLKEIIKKNIKGGIGGVGDNKRRNEMSKKIRESGLDLINAIDPSCIIVSSVSIGRGVTIWPGVIINSHAIIKDNVIINCGAIIEHECIIREGVHIGPGVKLAGRVEVKENAFVGIGAVVKEGIKIGENSIVGAGAVVIEDIPPNVIVVGIPAKIIKQR